MGHLSTKRVVEDVIEGITITRIEVGVTKPTQPYANTRVSLTADVADGVDLDEAYAALKAKVDELANA